MSQPLVISPICSAPVPVILSAAIAFGARLAGAIGLGDTGRREGALAQLQGSQTT